MTATLPGTGTWTIDTDDGGVYTVNVDTRAVTFWDGGTDSTGYAVADELFIADEIHAVVGEALIIDAHLDLFDEKSSVRVAGIVLGITPADVEVTA